MAGSRVGERLLVWMGTQVRIPGAWRAHLWLRQVLRIHAVGVREVVRGGLRWVLDPSDYVQSDVFWFGRKDVWDVYHLKRLARPGCVFVDVGANFGYYSLAIVQHLKGDCTIHAFEPCPSTFERLALHIQLNGMQSCIHAHALGVSNARGMASIVTDRANSGCAYLNAGGGTVPLVSLDEFCAEHGLERVDLMKVDVEGFEPAVLKGAARIIRRSRPVLLVEVNPATLKRTNSTPEDVLGELGELGYNLFCVNRRRLVPFHGMPADGSMANVLCISSDQAGGSCVPGRGGA